MDLDQVVDDEFHSGQPDTVGRQPPPLEGGGRAGNVDHHPGAGLRHGAEVDLLGLEGQFPPVDEALVALGTGDRDHLAIRERGGGDAGADDGRHAQFAADDRRVAGGAAVIGDDAGRAGHDRHPVRVGHLGDQNGAVHEFLDVGRVLDHAGHAARDAVADRDPGHQQRAAFGQGAHREPGSALLRVHRLRTRLHEEQFAGQAVFGPFHVHRAAVVVLHDHGPAAQLHDLRVGQHERLPLAFGGVDRAGAGATALGIDHLPGLLAEGLLDDGCAAGLVEQRLEDEVFVGVDRALHHRFAEPPGGTDHGHARKAGVGVDGEHHPGAADVGSDHPLHADRERHIEVVEVLDLAVTDRPVGEEGGVTAAAGVEQVALTRHVEERLLLPGEAGVGQVLGGGAAAHGDRQVRLPGLLRELPIRGTDAVGDVRGKLTIQEQLAQGLTRDAQRGAAFVEQLQLAPQFRLDPVCRDECAVGVRGRREPVGHLHAVIAEGTHHLAQRRVLTADLRNVAQPDLVEPHHTALNHCLPLLCEFRGSAPN